MIKIMKYGEVDNKDIFARGTAATSVEDIVTGIIENVKANGDKALFEYCEKFDKAKLTALEVSAEEIEEAFNTVEPKFVEIIRAAAENVREFHSRQVRNSFILNEKDGIVIGQKVIPIEKVGLYVPGGTAAYPSTVLMDSIPAKIAGCKEIVMVTPPNAEGRSILLSLRRLKLQALTASSRSAVHRQLQPLLTVQRVCRRSIKSSAPAMHLLLKQKSRFSVWFQSI